MTCQCETKIYALIDPESPQHYRYIGKTLKPLNIRLQEHLESKSNKDKRDWIANLIEEGRHPQIVLLKKVKGPYWREHERKEILKAKLEGHDLLNILPGGEGGGCSCERALFKKEEIREEYFGEYPPQRALPMEDALELINTKPQYISKLNRIVLKELKYYEDEYERVKNTRRKKRERLNYNLYMKKYWEHHLYCFTLPIWIAASLQDPKTSIFTQEEMETIQDVLYSKNLPKLLAV